MEILDCLYDGKINCWSILTSMNLSEYLEMVQNAHNNDGALDGQRTVLKTTSARRIRERMFDDIKNGAILPPVVLGNVVAPKNIPSVLLEKNSYNSRLEFSETQRPEIVTFLMSERSNISIIDGMQRTAVYRELMKSSEERPIRVEFWVAEKLTSIIYRMLVLNTGQIPWTVEQQINVVYKPLISEIKQNTSIPRVIEINEPGRRTQPGQYQAKDLVALYVAFSNQKIDSDPKMTIAEEFAKQDLIEAISEPEFQEYFYKTLDLMYKLDQATYISDRDLGKKSIFDSQPARIGFMVALSIKILGKNGREKTPEQINGSYLKIAEDIDNFASKLSKMSDIEKTEFLQLDDLEALLNERSTQIGRRHRQIFRWAFDEMVENKFDNIRMVDAWMKYSEME